MIALPSRRPARALFGDVVSQYGSHGAMRRLEAPPMQGQWSCAPAVEYNWSGRLGPVAGAQLPVAGHDPGRTITPQLALNMAF